MAEKKEHMVFFPFMAQGHLIPFLALALQIEQKKGYSITYINTPLNIKKLRSSIPKGSAINLLEIPFNSSDHGLPPDTENTDSVHYDLVWKLIDASSSLKPSFRSAIHSLNRRGQRLQPPVCIITDMFFGWCSEVAREFDIFLAVFLGGSAFGFGCYYSMWVDLPHTETGSDEFTLPDFPEASRIHVTQMAEYLRRADGNDFNSKLLRKLLPEWGNCDGLLINSIADIDRLGLMFLRRKFGLPVWPIGPVLLSGRAGEEEEGTVAEMCRNWLNTLPSKSVLYVSFGSQNTVPASHIMELAKALESSGRNFIWVVRPPLGHDLNSEFKSEEWLPWGFEDRVRASGRGLLVRKWAPQVEILSHSSVGVFLSHCGWNSVLESLSQGVPILGWPLAAEQFYNAKLLEEHVGVCVEIARGKSCEVEWKAMAEKIELVMGDTEKGNDMRGKARVVREIIQEAVEDDEEGQKIGSSVKALDEFLDAAIAMKENCRKALSRS